MPIEYPERIIHWLSTDAKKQPLATHEKYPFPGIGGLEKPSVEAKKVQAARLKVKTEISKNPSTSEGSEDAKKSGDDESKQTFTNSPFSGVTRLSVVVGSGADAIVSPTFNNGKGDATKEGRYFDTPDSGNQFCFAPGSDAPKICWKVRNTDRFEEVKLELFCKGRSDSIWETKWDRAAIEKQLGVGKISAGSKPKDDKIIPIQWSGSLDWNSAVQIDKQLKFNPADPNPAFSDGILTVEHSPYQLRMTINGGDAGNSKMGYPLVAWTYIHILVHEIKLSWGTDNVIPTSRTDISDANSRTAMLAQEKKILADLKASNLSLSLDGNQPNATHDVILDSTVFKYPGGFSEFPFFKEMWGDGPHIPLFAEATIKKADQKSGVSLPNALGRMKFLWEWQDNDGESRDDWLKRWIGDTTDPSNKTSSITRYYLDAIFKAFQNPKYPYHAFNCPAKAGGKRGENRPKPMVAEKVKTQITVKVGNQETQQPKEYTAAHIFPAQTGTDTFPFKVTHELKNRDWTAVSYLGQIVGNTARTGVLFQPAAVSGDRYKITVYLIADLQPDGSSSLDIDQVKNQYYNLFQEATKGHLPVTSTRYFNILRGLRMTYFYAADFAATYGATLNQFKQKIEQELGYRLTINAQPFPNDLHLQITQDDLSDLIAEKYVDGNSALFIRSLFPVLSRQSNTVPVNYALSTPTRQQAWANLENFFKSAPLSLLKLSYQQSGHDANGREFVVPTTSHRGVCLVKPEVYKTVLEGFEISVLTNTDNQKFAQNSGRQIKLVQSSLSTALISDIKSIDNLFWQTCWGLTIEIKETAGLSSQTVRVVVPACTNAGTPEKIELTLERSISVAANRVQPMKEFLAGLLTKYPMMVGVDQPLHIELHRKPGNDNNAKSRTENLKAYLETQILDRKFFIKQGALDHAKKPPEERFFDRIKPGIDDLFTRCFMRKLKALPQYNTYATEGQLFFYHLRGLTPLSVSPEGEFNSGMSSEKLGFGYVIEVAHSTYKRLYKDTLSILAHEFGHALSIDHAPARSLESPVSGPSLAHLSYDTCVMNYDPHSQTFCGVDILNKRGWFYRGIVPALNEPTNAAWQTICEQSLTQASTSPASAETTATALHLTMFTLGVRKNEPTAKQIFQTAEGKFKPLSATPEDIWWLRNQIIFHKQRGDLAKATQFLNGLVSKTTNALDIGDLYIMDAQNQRQVLLGGEFGVWNAGGDEFDYQITVEVGEIDDLFLEDVNQPKGKKARLQVLGLFNRPLEHPESDACLTFAWNHALSLFPNLHQSPNTVLADEIKRFLVGTPSGKLPVAGTTAKVRLPSFTTLYSQYELSLRFPEWDYPRENGYQEGEKPEEKPFANFGLGSDPYRVEAKVYRDNPAMGKIPLKVQVQRRPKNARSAPWTDAPNAVLYVELIKPDPLPAYDSTKVGMTASHSVAGGSSFFAQASTPPLHSAPQAYLEKIEQKIRKLDPINDKDPQESNTHVSVGGKRQLSKTGDLSERSHEFYSPFDQEIENLFEIITAPGQFQQLPKCDGADRRPNTATIQTDAAGIAKIVFMPSRVGGDRYKLKFSVGKPTTDSPSEGMETGTMIRWRALRICRYLQMPVHTSKANLPAYLAAVVDKPGAPDFFQQPPTLPPVDFQNTLTHELAKAYCELIVEQQALHPEQLDATHHSEFLQEIKRLINQYEWQANCTYWAQSWDKQAKEYNPTVTAIQEQFQTVDQQQVKTGNETGTQFESVLNAPKLYLASLTVRLPGENWQNPSVYYSDGNPSSFTQSNAPVPLAVKASTVTQATFDYATRKLSVTFNTPRQVKDIKIWYKSADYFHIDSLLEPFPAKSPYLFNLRLPVDYNHRISQLAPNVYRPISPDDPNWNKPWNAVDDFWKGGSIPNRIAATQAAQFINSRAGGLVKGLFMLALVRGLGNNQGFYPGLVVIQALSLDPYGDGAQEGKNVGNGIYLFGSNDQKVALHELAHGLYLQHAPNNPASAIPGKDPAGSKPDLHDKQDVCIMSYAANDGDFCGQCVASLQGMNTREESFASANQ